MCEKLIVPRLECRFPAFYDTCKLITISVFNLLYQLAIHIGYVGVLNT
jgi:hypothetical protein